LALIAGAEPRSDPDATDGPAYRGALTAACDESLVRVTSHPLRVPADSTAASAFAISRLTRQTYNPS